MTIKDMLTLPIVKRKLYCMASALVVGIAMSTMLDGESLSTISLLQLGVVINYLVIALVVTLAGAYASHPLMPAKVHAPIRGAVLAAFVSLNSLVMYWGQSGFWAMLITATVFGSILDATASSMFPVGKKLLKGME